MLFFAEAFFLGLLFNAAPGIVFTETIKNGWNDGEPVQASADSFDARRGRISTFWPQKKNGVWE